METLLKRVLGPAQLKPQYVDVLMRRMDLYEQAFTAKSYDPKRNYEIFETLGDAAANNFVTWYFFRRYPQLNCTEGVKVLARLKINYSSKVTFSRIADKLGFWPYIRASEEQKRSDKRSLLEDVLESFVAVTIMILDEEFAIGVGFNVVYDILKHSFDEIPVSLEYEDLYDPKSRLKELFDARKSELGEWIQENIPVTINRQKLHQTTYYRKLRSGEKIRIGYGTGRKKIDSEQVASQEALEVLKKAGYTRKVDYSVICE